MLKDTLRTSFALRVYTVLIMLYLTVVLACGIVAYKIIALGSWFLMGSGVIFPLLYVFIDMITELFGGGNARFALILHIVCGLLFSYIILFIIRLKSPIWWTFQSNYEIVADPMGRLYASSAIGYIASSIINIHLIQRLKVLMHGKWFYIRSVFSSGIGILIYTVVTDLLAYRKALSMQHLYTITIFNVFTNILLVAAYAIISAFIVRTLKSFIETTNDQASFNPFKV